MNAIIKTYVYWTGRGWGGLKTESKEPQLPSASIKGFVKKQEEVEFISKINKIMHHIDRASAVELASLGAVKARLVELQQASCEAAAVRIRLKPDSSWRTELSLRSLSRWMRWSGP